MRTPGPIRIAVLEGIGSENRIREALASPIGIEELVILEPSLAKFHQFKNSPSTKDLIENPRIEWILDARPDEIPDRFFRALSKRNRHLVMRSSMFFKDSNYTPQEEEYFQSAQKHWADVCNLVEMGRGYLASNMLALQNTFDNLDLIEKNPGFKDLENSFRGIPAVVISTGPSLPKSLAFLKTIQSKCILISADASLKILLEAGICPHIVCTTERDEGTKPFLESALDKHLGPKPHFVSLSLVPRAVVDAMQGPLWFGYMDMSIFGFFEAQLPRGTLSIGHSVAHLCARLATHLGCSEVVLIGQDLAYDPENYSSHSAGFHYSESTKSSSLEQLKRQVESRGEQFLFVEGNDRHEVPTSSDYLMFIREFETIIRDVATPILNATVGGAKISGARWGKLEEFSKNWENIPPPIQTLDELRNKIEYPDQFDPSDFISNLDQTKAPLMQCIEILRNHIHRLDDPNTKSALAAIAHELRGVQKKLLKEDLFRTCSIDYIGTRFIQIENQWAQLWEADDESLPQRMRLLEEWFGECLKAVNQIQSIVLNSTRKMLQKKQIK